MNSVPFSVVDDPFAGIDREMQDAEDDGVEMQDDGDSETPTYYPTKMD